MLLLRLFYVITLVTLVLAHDIMLGNGMFHVRSESKTILYGIPAQGGTKPYQPSFKQLPQGWSYNEIGAIIIPYAGLSGVNSYKFKAKVSDSRGQCVYASVQLYIDFTNSSSPKVLTTCNPITKETYDYAIIIASGSGSSRVQSVQNLKTNDAGVSAVIVLSNTNIGDMVQSSSSTQASSNTISSSAGVSKPTNTISSKTLDRAVLQFDVEGLRKVYSTIISRQVDCRNNLNVVMNFIGKMDSFVQIGLFATSQLKQAEIQATKKAGDLQRGFDKINQNLAIERSNTDDKILKDTQNKLSSVQGQLNQIHIDECSHKNDLNAKQAKAKQYGIINAKFNGILVSNYNRMAELSAKITQLKLQLARAEAQFAGFQKDSIEKFAFLNTVLTNATKTVVETKTVIAGYNANVTKKDTLGKQAKELLYQVNRQKDQIQSATEKVSKLEKRAGEINEDLKVQLKKMSSTTRDRLLKRVTDVTSESVTMHSLIEQYRVKCFNGFSFSRVTDKPDVISFSHSKESLKRYYSTSFGQSQTTLPTLSDTSGQGLPILNVQYVLSSDWVSTYNNAFSSSYQTDYQTYQSWVALADGIPNVNDHPLPLTIYPDFQCSLYWLQFPSKYGQVTTINQNSVGVRPNGEQSDVILYFSSCSSIELLNFGDRKLPQVGDMILWSGQEAALGTYKVNSALFY